MDKSVHLLGTKNRITLSGFFDRLRSLNLGKHDGVSQKDDDAYCRAKRKSLEVLLGQLWQLWQINGGNETQKG